MNLPKAEVQGEQMYVFLMLGEPRRQNPNLRQWLMVSIDHGKTSSDNTNPNKKRRD